MLLNLLFRCLLYPIIHCNMYYQWRIQGEGTGRRIGYYLELYYLELYGIIVELYGIIVVYLKFL